MNVAENQQTRFVWILQEKERTWEGLVSPCGEEEGLKFQWEEALRDSISPTGSQVPIGDTELGIWRPKAFPRRKEARNGASSDEIFTHQCMKWIIWGSAAWERIKPLGADLPIEEAPSLKFTHTFDIFSYRPCGHGRKPPYSLGSLWPCMQKTWLHAPNHITWDCHHECERGESPSGWGHGEPLCCLGLEASDGTSKETSPCK